MPTVQRACATAGVRLGRRRRDRGHRRARAWPARCWSASPRRRRYALALDKPLYGVNHLAAHVAVDQLEHGPLPEPCDRAAGLRRALARCCWCPTWPRERRAARLDHRRRGGRGLRQGRPAARPALPGRSADRPGRARRRSGGHRLPARADRPAATAAPFDFSFSGLKTAVARWVEARERAGEPVPVADVAAASRRRSRDVLTAQGGARRAGARRRPRWCSAAAWRPTRGCARWPRSVRGAPASCCGCPRPRLCTDNGAMVAALGAAAGRGAASRRPEPDLGADSSLPIDVVTR